MNTNIEVIDRADLAVKIHFWAQDILSANSTCGLGKTVEGKYQVIWPGLINQWIHCPDEHGEYLGTLTRDSTPADIENLLEGEGL